MNCTRYKVTAKKKHRVILKTDSKIGKTVVGNQLKLIKIDSIAIYIMFQ